MHAKNKLFYLDATLDGDVIVVVPADHGVTLVQSFDVAFEAVPDVTSAQMIDDASYSLVDESEFLYNDLKFDLNVFAISYFVSSQNISYLTNNIA